MSLVLVNTNLLLSVIVLTIKQDTACLWCVLMDTSLSKMNVTGRHSITCMAVRANTAVLHS